MEGRTVGTVTVEGETTPAEGEGAAPLRVVIGEDSVLLLAGLVKLLDSAGFQVVATAGDGTALVDAVEREQPDLVIADVRMPPTHTDEGIRAALAIRGRWPDIAILVLSQYVEERYAADLLSANTSSVGYLLKDRVADVTQFLEALRRVAAGGTALDPEVVAQLLLRRGADPMEALTQRERDVLALMAEGRSNAEIGAALVITDSAVSKHINSIFAKLGLHQGDTGPAVGALQTFLNDTFPLYSHLDLDQQYGPKTAAVVAEFQRRAGVTGPGVDVDGRMVGPLTWAALERFGFH